MKTKICFGFKHHQKEPGGNFQIPLFMIIKEYFDDNGNIEFAKVLFVIKGKEMRNLEREMQKENTNV